MGAHAVMNSETNTEEIIVTGWVLRITVESGGGVRSFCNGGHHTQRWLKCKTSRGWHGSRGSGSWELRWTKSRIWYGHMSGLESISFVVIELLFGSVVWSGMNSKTGLQICGDICGEIIKVTGYWK